MTGLLLTDQEKRRFGEWLRAQASSADAMAKQFEAAGSPPLLMLAKRERTRAAAFEIVCGYVESGETFTLGGVHGEAKP